MNRVLITGGSGFIGSNLIASLTSSKIFKLPHKLLLDTDELEKTIKDFNPNEIYHLAAYGNMSNQKDEGETLISNILGTYNLLQATRDIPYKKFVNFSTSSVLLPHQTMYSATKVGAEALCRVFVDEYKKPITTVRPYSIYGEGEAEFRFIPTVIKALIYRDIIDLDTQATHDWVYVKDFISSLIELKEPTTYNMGTGYSCSNLEIVNRLERISGKKLSYNEKKLRSFDNNSWVAPQSMVISDLDAGLENTYNYYVRKFTSN